MLRRIVLIVIAILLSSYGAFAIHQHKDFGLFSGNIVERSYGAGFEHDRPILPFSNIQRARDVGSGGFALQLDRILISQRASAWGLGGISDAYQTGSGIGYQDHIIDGNDAQHVGLPIVVQQQCPGVGFGESVYN